MLTQRRCRVLLQACSWCGAAAAGDGLRRGSAARANRTSRGGAAGRRQRMGTHVSLAQAARRATSTWPLRGGTPAVAGTSDEIGSRPAR